MIKDLTTKQQRYVEGRSMGMTHYQAAKYAGYTNATVAKASLESNPRVQEAIHGAEKVNRERNEITRDQVTGMVIEAFDIARMTSDPASMIRATSELNRMNGYYEPERREIHISASVLETTGRLRILSDEELLRIADNTAIDITDYQVESE